MNYSTILEELFLQQEEYLGNNKLVNNIIPTVSVHVITYQHVNYIEDCLKGILMQKTNFPFEIVIGEDESDDGTRDICKKYAEEYPNKIRLFLRDRNKSVLKESGQTTYFNGKLTLKSCRGKYIALCEGDDYWTDPYKLQKQVDFMEKNEKFAGCAHQSKIIYTNSIESRLYSPIDTPKIIKVENLLDTRLFHTASFLFRAKILKSYSEFPKVFSGDRMFFLAVALKGDIHYVNDLMCIYRKNSLGISNNVKFEDLKRDLQIPIFFKKRYPKFPSKKMLTHIYITLAVYPFEKNIIRSIYFLTKAFLLSFSFFPENIPYIWKKLKNNL